MTVVLVELDVLPSIFYSFFMIIIFIFGQGIYLFYTCPALFFPDLPAHELMKPFFNFLLFLVELPVLAHL